MRTRDAIGWGWRDRLAVVFAYCLLPISTWTTPWIGSMVSMTPWVGMPSSAIAIPSAFIAAPSFGAVSFATVKCIPSPNQIAAFSSSRIGIFFPFASRGGSLFHWAFCSTSSTVSINEDCEGSTNRSYAVPENFAALSLIRRCCSPSSLHPASRSSILTRANFSCSAIERASSARASASLTRALESAICDSYIFAKASAFRASASASLASRRASAESLFRAAMARACASDWTRASSSFRSPYGKAVSSMKAANKNEPMTSLSINFPWVGLMCLMNSQPAHTRNPIIEVNSRSRWAILTTSDEFQPGRNVIHRLLAAWALSMIFLLRLIDYVKSAREGRKRVGKLCFLVAVAMMLLYEFPTHFLLGVTL
jgi:hypothetical protein